MNYSELAAAARGKMGEWCRACPVCDGRGCRNHIPGPGAKGVGDVAIRNHDAWGDLRVNMDTLHEPFVADTSLELFGRELVLPVLIAPVGDVSRHYGPDYDTLSYNRCVLEAASEFGTIALTGDGPDESIMREACGLIARLDGAGIPTIKPWGASVVADRLRMALEANPVAVAMDVDGAGLPFLRGCVPPAGAKSVADLSRIAKLCDRPFVDKGVMTPQGAEKAVSAGADAIVVSNHGGRVLDGVPATAEVLPQIVDAVGGDITILVDGGIRTGLDVFRALALGADAVMVCRPFVVATYAAGKQGVTDYLAQLQRELADTMEMCGAATLADIDEDMVFS